MKKINTSSWSLVIKDMKKRNDLLKDNAKRENPVESDYILKQINKFQFPDNSECSNLILTIV
jgi:hypothetical protein